MNAQFHPHVKNNEVQQLFIAREDDQQVFILIQPNGSFIKIEGMLTRDIIGEGVAIKPTYLFGKGRSEGDALHSYVEIEAMFHLE